MNAKRGRPRKVIVPAAGRIIDLGAECEWVLEDGRTLVMPWSVGELWARLCRQTHEHNARCSGDQP